MRRRTIIILAAAAVLAAGGAATAVAIAANDQGPESSPSRIATDRDCPKTGPLAPPLRMTRRQFTVTEIGKADAPISAVFANDGSRNGYLGQRDGTVRRIDHGHITNEVSLDLTDDTLQKGDGGLMALAYDPDGEWLYVERTTADKDDVVTAYPLDDTGRPRQSDEREIIRSDHPDSIQHHGGAFVFGSDGMLYLGFGDGGGLGDPRENAERTSVLLGKILRIHPTPEGAEPYEVPKDNPFVGQSDRAPEIWMYGVRNPFRMGLDTETGDLWLGDVGQSCWEELDRLTAAAAGSDLGWDRKEGTHTFEGGEITGPEIEPSFEINHGSGWCSIVAGYVPRSSDVPQLDGHLLFTDYCHGQLWMLDVEASRPGAPVLRNTGLHFDQPIAVVEGPDKQPWILTFGGSVLEVGNRGS